MYAASASDVDRLAGRRPAFQGVHAVAPGAVRPIRLIVLHCSATPNARTLFSGKSGTPGFRDPAMEIDAWHAARGFRRDTYWRGRQNAALKAIGYHYVVARNGALFTGRHEDEPGAHAEGWNQPSLGICLVGTDRYTEPQWRALHALVGGLCARLGIPAEPAALAEAAGKRRIIRPGVCGHRDLPGVAKACPGFDVAAWLAGGMAPLDGHVDEART